MDTINWPGLSARLWGRAIVDLWYDRDAGAVTILLGDGSSVLIIADSEGCHVIQQSAAERSNT